MKNGMGWMDAGNIKKKMKLGYTDRQLSFSRAVKYSGMSTRLGKMYENGDSILIGRTNMYSWVQRA